MHFLLLALLAAPLPDEAFLSRLSIEADAESRARLGDDPNNTYATRGVTASGLFLLPRSINLQDQLALVQPFIDVSVRVGRLELTSLGEARQIVRFGGGGGVLLGTRSKELFILGFNLGESGETDALGSAALRLGAYGFGTYRFSSEVTGLYGLFFGYSFGRGLVLPALGVRWKMSSDVSLSVFLPFHARLSWQVNREARLDLALGLHGARDSIEATTTAGTPGTVQLGSARGELALGARIQVAERVNLGLKGGLRAGGRVFIDDGEVRTFDQMPRPALFGAATLSVLIGDLLPD